MDGGPSRGIGMLAGATAAAVSLGVSEVASGASRRIPSLVVAVGDVIVDWAPFGVVESAISLFGTGDKKALVAGTVVLALAFGALLGRGATRRWWIGLLGFAAFGALGLLAADRQHTASIPLTALTTGAAVAAGALTLALLLWVARETAGRPASGATGLDRRAFLGLTATGLVVAAGGAVTGHRLRKRLNVEAARAAVRLPQPVRADPDVTSAALAGVAGLTPLVTPNEDFYRIDTALLVPQVDPEDWSLRIHGRVDSEVELSYPDLLGLPMTEDYVTLACVSNEVGGDLVGTAKWLGVPLAGLLDQAGPHREATQVVGRSVDGFTVGFPTAAVRDGRTALVAVGMNGRPLPVRHGFPARLVVAGLYGYVSATKWLSEIELTRWEDFDAYWIPRGWAKEAPVKTQSRIDAPRHGRTLTTGTIPVAGVAWAPGRGIAKVEVRIDDGPWEQAGLSGSTPDDAWRQWRYPWEATPGAHDLAVRATNGEGEIQTDRRSSAPPDGATGHHTITVTVE